MNILKVSFFSTIETALKLVAGLVVLKLLAFNAGPEAVAKFGQFQNFLSIITVLISGSLITGLVKFVSEKSTEKTYLKTLERMAYLNAGLSFGFFCSILISLVLILSADKLSLYIFSTTDLKIIFYFLAISLIFIVIYQATISYLNGLGMIKEMVLVKVFSSFSLLLFGSSLIYFYGFIGSLIGLICIQVASGFFALIFLFNLNEFSWRLLKPSYNKNLQKKLAPYWVMNLVSLISSALVLILIRKHVAVSSGWGAAGIWEATWKISELSLLLITTALTVYYVPMLSRTNNVKAEVDRLSKVTFFALTTAIFISILIYMLREVFIVTLFSEKFLGVTAIIKFQLLGGLIRIVGWVIGFHMIIKSRPSVFIFTEVVFGCTFYFLSILLFNLYGLVGLTYAFMINNLFFLFFGFVYLTNYFYKKRVR